MFRDLEKLPEDIECVKTLAAWVVAKRVAVSVLGGLLDSWIQVRSLRNSLWSNRRHFPVLMDIAIPFADWKIAGFDH